MRGEVAQASPRPVAHEVCEAAAAADGPVGVAVTALEKPINTGHTDNKCFFSK